MPFSFPLTGPLLIKSLVFFRLGPVFIAQCGWIKSEIEIDEGDAQFRMIGRTMVALAIVLQCQLPVALLHDIGLVRDLGVADVIGRQPLLHRFHEALHVGRRVARKADIDQPADRNEIDRLEVAAGPVEVDPRVRCMDQLAGQLVSPLMVGADELRDYRGAGVKDARSTVTADIMEDTQLIIIVTQKNDAVSTDVDDLGVTGFRSIAFKPDTNPLAAEENTSMSTSNTSCRV